MCGIAGIVGNASKDPLAAVASMLRRLEHRGPDEEGLRDVGGAVLGVRRLAIIDVRHGQQPRSDELEQVFAVQNGEIYNYREVRARLEERGHSFRTDSDTEVLPYAYIEYGEAFAQHLRGMFAVAIWDTRSRRLILARDRLGKKPLFYARTASGIAFASEIQALIDLGVSREVDDDAIREYLRSGYIRAPRCAFRNIRKVAPASIVTFAGGAIAERMYWRISFTPKLKLSEAEALEALDVKLAESVRIRLIGEVPLGAFLSGGIDSSTVVAYMARVSDRPVKTFSIGFRDRQADEVRFARMVAQRFATDHREFVVDPVAADVLPMLLRHVGEPFADASIVPTYYVAKIAREHVTVALNGDGGDELFAGYERYRAAVLASRLDSIPSPLRRALAFVARSAPEPGGLSGIRRVRRFAMTLGMTRDARYRRWSGSFGDDRRILGPRLRSLPEQIGDVREADSDYLEQLLGTDMEGYLPDDLLVKMDIASMAASLEARSPFLDHELVELVNHLPSAMKLRGTEPKYLLRRLMTGVLPVEILRRPKMGFGAPVGHWLRGPLRDLVEELVLAAPDRGYVDRTEAARVVAEMRSDPASNGLLVWSLVVLELWFQHVVHADVSAIAA